MATAEKLRRFTPQSEALVLDKHGKRCDDLIRASDIDNADWRILRPVLDHADTGTCHRKSIYHRFNDDVAFIRHKFSLNTA